MTENEWRQMDRLDKQGCWIGAQPHSAGGEGGHLSPVGKALLAPA